MRAFKMRVGFTKPSPESRTAVRRGREKRARQARKVNRATGGPGRMKR